MTEVEEKVIEQAPEKPKGRTAILEMYKSTNPDVDPDDDGLLDFAHDRISDSDRRYGELNSANARLSELASKDPRLGAVLSMIVGENSTSLPYAMGRVFGKEWIEADLDEFEKGYQENLARLAESKAEQEQAAKNIEEYQSNLESFAKENELTEDQVSELSDAIYADAVNFLMGIIPVEFIAYKWKGMNYDKDVEEAAVTGEVEGRNQAIEVKKKKIVGEAPLPDLGNGSGAGKPRGVTAPKKRGSFFDEIDKNLQ